MVDRPVTGGAAALLRTVRERLGAGRRAGDDARLDDLEVHLDRALAHGRELQAECDSLRRALAHARAELRGTRDGELRALHAAHHDELTALPNRSAFRARLEAALSGPPGAAALTVLYLDLDGFKAINDTHGHEVGDGLLCIVAQRLSRAVRSEDMMSRLGGDEFACLLDEPPQRTRLERLATKLHEAVSAPVRLGALELRVSPSIGLASAPTDGFTPEQLLRRADLAMYRAKRLRCGHAFFEPAMDGGGPVPAPTAAD